jgi:hypothetical protein
VRKWHPALAHKLHVLLAASAAREIPAAARCWVGTVGLRKDDEVICWYDNYFFVEKQGFLL